ncbi:unnamed protein product [Schistosoma turkestanicum]|nr:unnamed protein product [Schistosoma turkestanicum]
MNSFRADKQFKVISSHSITLNVPQPTTQDDYIGNTHNNDYIPISCKQITPTIRNAYSSKSREETKSHKRRILSLKSTKSDRTCLQMPKTSPSMHGKLKLTNLYNNNSSLFNDTHNQKRHSDAFISSFAIRKSSPNRKKCHREHHPASTSWRRAPACNRQSKISSLQSTNNVKPNNSIQKHFPSTSMTIINLINSAQCLVISSLKSCYTRTMK